MIWNHPVETTIKNWLFGVPGGDYKSFDLHGAVTKNAGVFPEIWCTTATLVERSEMPPVVAFLWGNPTGGKDVWFWSGGPQRFLTKSSRFNKRTIISKVEVYCETLHLMVVWNRTSSPSPIGDQSIQLKAELYRLEDSRWTSVWYSWYMQWLEPEPQSKSIKKSWRLEIDVLMLFLFPGLNFSVSWVMDILFIFKNCLWNQGTKSWF